MSGVQRRTVLKLGFGAFAAAAIPLELLAAESPAKSGTKVVLLGTKGGPRVTDGRANPANLLLVDGVPYVIDCGYGVTRQLVRAGVRLPALRYVFITHHHSDHNLEYGNLLYNAWVAGLKDKVETFGPPGLQEMTQTFWTLNKFDIETRIADEGRPDLRTLVQAHDFQAGEVFRNGSVRVTAFKTPHPPVTENYAFRFETADRTVVFSADTAFNPALAEFAKGADVLVHEVMYEPGIDAMVKRIPNGATLKAHLIASHTLTEDVGRVAAAAGVKTLVLNHLVPGDDDSITDEMWADGVRKHFNGTVIVGKDLQVI